MSRVFVTGATGFIGSAAARQLIAAGHEVAILRRATSNLSRLETVKGRFDSIEGDLTNIASWKADLKAWRPDVFVHCAWDGVLGRLRNDPIQFANVATTVETVELAAEAGAKTWIGLGSQAEYGPANDTISENFPCNPTTEYGKAKAMAFQQAREASGKLGLRFVWLRVFSTYGPGDSFEWMIPSLIEKLLDGEKPPLTLGEQLWDYLNVEDAGRAIVAVTEAPEAQGAFNLGSGEAVPLRQLIEAIRDSIDETLPLGFGEVPYRPDQVMILHANIDRLREATGWKPQVPLVEGIAATVAWHRAQRAQTG